MNTPRPDGPQSPSYPYGRLIIDLDGEGGRSVELTPRHGFVVPKGVVHRTRARERTVMLMVEGAGIVPTGD